MNFLTLMHSCYQIFWIFLTMNHKIVLCFSLFQVLYLQSVICLTLSVIPLLSTSHGVHHSLYLVQLSLDITYQLLVMEHLLTTLHQTVIMCYSGVILLSVMIPVYLCQDTMDWMENFKPYVCGNPQVNLALFFFNFWVSNTKCKHMYRISLSSTRWYY